MTKLLVGTGYNGSHLASVEIIDLSSQKIVCQDLPEFPQEVALPLGGFYDLKNAMICGGWTGKVIFYERRNLFNCFYWSFTKSTEMTVHRILKASTFH